MAIDGLWLYRFPSLADAPGLVHAVSGRTGGVSEGHLSSLNLSMVVGDRREAVLENRRRLAKALGIPPERLIKSGQVHGTDCIVVDEATLAAGIAGPDDSPLRADCLLTAERDVYLFMTFADCVPVLLYDPVRQVVGLVHAGWQGTVAGAARRAVLAAGEAFGSRPEDMRVGIGPSIGACCYEVGQDVAGAVERAFPSAEGLLRPVNGRLHLDLWRANVHQLEQIGVPAANIEVAGVCSGCRTDILFSHRKEKGRTGRMGAVIGLRGQ